ncbi:MAG: tetratricopeptide repeat protein, partial [Elusimicrobiaceae bacterium]|nr:tetratricopeptide repeat protein [Elusimicrobiaceae bacterium]
MKRILFFFFFFITAICAANELSEQERLNQAAALYFSYQPEKSLNAYIQISKETQSRDAFLNAAFIAMEQSNPKLAVDIATAAYHLYPQDDEIAQTAAEAYLADGQYASAEVLLSQLPELPGRKELLHINLARAQIGLGEKKLAQYNLRQASRGKVHTALSNYLLGLLYEEEKNYKKAVKHFKAAAEYDHQFIEAKKHYANALEQTRNYNEAYRQYRMLYSMDKNLQDVNQALTRLHPKLTRPEHEITGGKVKDTHTLVKPFILEEGQTAAEIKVGLGMRSNGKPPQRNNLTFIPSHAFVITNEHGKEIARGKARERWQAVLEKSTAYVLSPSGKKISFHKSVIVTPVPNSSGEGTTILIKQLVSGAGMT